MDNVTTPSYSAPERAIDPDAIDPDAIDPDAIDPAVWKITGVVLLGPLMTTLDSTVVNVSLATLGRELHAPLTAIQWVTSGYLLAMALMLPVSGWLVDRIGVKRVYLGCFTAFTLASLLCGTATSATGLIICRVLQGMSGGLLAPMAQMMVARIAGRHVARVMGFMVVPILIGPILGPVLAGAILQHASWRWIFFINLPIGVLAIALAAWLLPVDTEETQHRTFDLTGFLLLSPALVLLLHSLERLGAARSRQNEVELAAAALLVAAFAWHSVRRGRAALIDVHLFRRPGFAASTMTQFLINAVAYGGQLLLPLYLLTVRGRSPSDTGLLLVPLGIGMLCSYPTMGALTERFGPRTVSTTGAIVALLGTLPLALIAGQDLPMPLLAIALFVRGAGMGGIGIPSLASAYAAISKPMIPVATTTLNIVQRLGGPIATTVLVIYLHTRPTVAPQAFVATFRLLCAIHLLTIVAASRLPVRARPAAP